MNGRNIIALILAVVAGIVGYFILKTIIASLFTALVIGGIAFFAYRKFNNMLSSGKRLT